MKRLLVSQTRQWLELQPGMGLRKTDALMRKYQDYLFRFIQAERLHFKDIELAKAEGKSNPITGEHVELTV